MGSRLGARLHGVPRLALYPAAAGGLVAGHFFTYVLVAPATAHRTSLLNNTGHSYFTKAIAAAAALGAIAMGASAARGVARRHDSSATLGWRAIASRMVVLQALGFVVLEAGERTIVGAPLSGIASVLPIGFAIEAIVALAVAALLCLTVRAAATIVRSLERRPFGRAAASLGAPATRDDVRPLLELLASCVTGRGPPVPFTV